MTGSIDIVKQLVAQFKYDEDRLCSISSGYTETEVRAEFIDPLFECLGWDMSNSQGLPNRQKEVIREESQFTETTTKRPDYTFRIAAIRKFFVEAKKPAVDIRTNKHSAFQVRSYGWTAGLPVSVLTNFRTIRLYDTQLPPKETDHADVGLLLDVSFEELPIRFNELFNLLGREAVARGSIDEKLGAEKKVNLPINIVFLERINNWRLRIAADLHSRYTSLGLNSLNDLVQKVINRIIFIRMCEDRGIEGAERLRKVAGKKDFLELRRFFREMDNRYNTGLFDIKSDPFQGDYTLNSQLFLDIVDEVYYPNAPYSFSVLDADFLGQVYEIFLVKRLKFNEFGELVLENKPEYEDREIVTTPQPLVGEIVRRAFAGRVSALNGSGTASFEDLKQMRVLDIAVGSGRFLLRGLDELIDSAIIYFVKNKDFLHVYQRAQGEYRLSFEAKKELLSSCIFGIDIDYNAVEIARFSLLVKLLEDESESTLPTGRKILPNLDKNIVWGNSVVGKDFTNSDDSIMELTHPFDWDMAGLPSSFDVIIGNPPYVKTEYMVAKTPDEYNYYLERYITSYQQFDKYFIFIEKSIAKLKSGAWCGMVVSNKWLTIDAGINLRRLLSSEDLVAEIVDFGNELVFERKSTYVCLLVLSKVKHNSVYYRHVDDYKAWLINPEDKGIPISLKKIQDYGSSSWILYSNEIEMKVLSTLYHNSVLLKEITDVKNGIQTSAEDIFAISRWSEDTDIIKFTRNGEEWKVEKSITRPYLMDSKSRVWSYLSIQSDALIIFPYEYGENGRLNVFTPERMEREFPLTWKYFKAFEERLRNRKVDRPEPDVFYQYGRRHGLANAFKGAKIIYSVNQLGDKYGFDETGVGYASGGTAGEVSISNARSGYALEFILALLNQRVIEFFLRKSGSPFRGGYYSRGSGVVKELPVPVLDFSNQEHVEIHNRIVELVRQQIDFTNAYYSAVGRQRELISSKRQAVSLEIANFFNQLWGLQNQDSVVLPGE